MSSLSLVPQDDPGADAWTDDGELKPYFMLAGEKVRTLGESEPVPSDWPDLGRPDEWESYFQEQELVRVDGSRWTVRLAGRDVRLTTKQLFDFKAVQREVAEQATLLLPTEAGEHWESFLYTKLNVDGVVLAEAPPVEGLILAELKSLLEFGLAEGDSENVLLVERELIFSPEVVKELALAFDKVEVHRVLRQNRIFARTRRVQGHPRRMYSTQIEGEGVTDVTLLDSM